MNSSLGRIWGTVALGALAVTLTIRWFGFSPAHPQPTPITPTTQRDEPLTFHRDIEPILQQHCQSCHRPDQVAPFPLLTYVQAYKRSADLAAVVTNRTMPPWTKASGGGTFRDCGTLSEVEITRVAAWAQSGATEGDPAAAPPPRDFAADWPLGPPDRILQTCGSYVLGPEGGDEYRVFVVPTSEGMDRWVRAVDFAPGNRRVVHHVNVAFDISHEARSRDAADPLPGYRTETGFDLPVSVDLPIWTPGSRPVLAHQGTGFMLPSGADALILVHYHRTGKPEQDATSIGLYFDNQPDLKPIQTSAVLPLISASQYRQTRARFPGRGIGGQEPTPDDYLHDVFVVPPGNANFEVRGDTSVSLIDQPLSRDILITSLTPHMHWLGKDLELVAVLPDPKRTRLPLIRLDRWDFRWQGTYVLDQPVRVPAGASFAMVAHFNNSAANPANPNVPPRAVHWGTRSDQEMCMCAYSYIAASPEDDR